jgi:hypothetical protein
VFSTDSTKYIIPLIILVCKLKLGFDFGDEVAEFGGFFELEVGSGQIHLATQLFNEVLVLVFWNFTQV